jgi:hypothetical protein
MTTPKDEAKHGVTPVVYVRWLSNCQTGWPFSSAIATVVKPPNASPPLETLRATRFNNGFGSKTKSSRQISMWE